MITYQTNIINKMSEIISDKNNTIEIISNYGE